MMSDEIVLTEYELAVINLSLMKHAVLISLKQLPTIVDFTETDFDYLIEKIDKMQKIAWLKKQRII